MEKKEPTTGEILKYWKIIVAFGVYATELRYLFDQFRKSCISFRETITEDAENVGAKKE